MGLGLLGRGVGDTAFLAACGANVLVTDKKSEEELADSVAKIKKYPNITFQLGGHRKENFTNCDMVLKAAGVPLNSPYIQAAKDAGVPVVMSTALFARAVLKRDVRLVGITGTRGKSTVTHMVHRILERDGRRAHLGGNVHGVSTLALLDKIKSGDSVVLELDSWQLQGFGESKISPSVAVFTNFMPDHMNYYHGDLERYFADKTNIFTHQRKDDVLIASKQVFHLINKKRVMIPSRTIEPVSLSDEWTLRVPGLHNRTNAAFALSVANHLGIPREVSKEALTTFPGLPGRLEFIREIDGVRIYNDTIATTPQATCAGLQAIGAKNNVVLIMGGSDKELSVEPLLEIIPEYCKAIILLPGTGTYKFMKYANSLVCNIKEVGGLKEALYQAQKQACSGDIILFSPAFASFGLFKNEYDRGEQFVQFVKKIS